MTAEEAARDHGERGLDAFVMTTALRMATRAAERRGFG
jgi:hypothetical protein